MTAKQFIDQKQEDHFKRFGVYADTNSKIAEWVEEYHQSKIVRLKDRHRIIKQYNYSTMAEVESYREGVDDCLAMLQI